VEAVLLLGALQLHFQRAHRGLQLRTQALQALVLRRAQLLRGLALLLRKLHGQVVQLLLLVLLRGRALHLKLGLQLLLPRLALLLEALPVRGVRGSNSMVCVNACSRGSLSCWRAG
jgi:hypothetical protein